MQISLIIIIMIIIILLIIIALLYWLFGWKRLDTYDFAADEVVVEVTHPATTTTAEIVAAMQRFLRPPRGTAQPPRNVSQQLGVNQTREPRVDNNWRNRLQPPTVENARIVTFPTLNEETFSLITISLAPFSLLRLGGHRKRDLRPNDVIRVLDGAYTLQSFPLSLGEGISVQSISPNLFIKNVHHGGATGGPGSWPLEAGVSPKSGAAAAALKEYEFRLVGPMTSLQAYKDKINVGNLHIAILDTIPTKEMEKAAQDIINNSATIPTDPSLIRNLFVPVLDNTKYANSSELAALEKYTPPPLHYRMPDHSTFIAGIVHTIAPKATLHIYEVINSFGLGTLTSMAQGMINAVNDHYKEGQTSLIVHCSFMLDLANLNQVLTLADPAPGLPSLPKKSTHEVLKWLTSLKNVVVVAAAGNSAGSSTSSGGRPPARYPAAFKGVIGVGALPKGNPTYTTGRYIPASYSNLSFDPQNELSSDGFMTFGGEPDTPPPPPPGTVPISTKGVLGVYVGNLLKSSINANMNDLQLSSSRGGWAHWAGTSFAAPIITGLLAAQPGDPSISTAIPARVSPPSTAEGENVILVEQG